MYAFMLTDWVTIRGQSTIASIVQSEDCWLDLSGYQDIVGWLECKEVSAGGGTGVQLTYQTGATKDDALFVAVTAAVNIATGVTVTSMPKDVVTTPLARWLRYQLAVTGTPGTAWDATFRVFIAANAPGRGRPQVMPGGRYVPPSRLAGAGVSRSSTPIVGTTTPSVPLHLSGASTLTQTPRASGSTSTFAPAGAFGPRPNPPGSTG
jgi:hypothetical protein